MRLRADETLSWIMRRILARREKWTSDMGPELTAAQKNLSAAIASKRIEAWGRRGRHGPYERMPAELFRDRGHGLVVNAIGSLDLLPAHRIVKYAAEIEAAGSSDPRDIWHEIEFVETMIKSAFPASPSQPARDWMLREAKKCAEAGARGKRDILVKDCMKTVGCTKRQALAAYDELPEQLRRKRGKPTAVRGR